MLSSFFNPQAPFWRQLSAFTDLLILSVLWFFCSLPLITIGAATAALYDSVARFVRPGRSGAALRFLTVFRRELAAACVSTLIWGGILFAALALLRLCWQGLLGDWSGASLFFALYLVALLIPAGALCWSFPILSRFTCSPLELLRISFFFSLAHLPSTVLIVLIAALAVAVCVLFLLPVVLLPAAAALCWSFLMERAFQKHMPPSASEPPPAP